MNDQTPALTDAALNEVSGGLAYIRSGEILHSLPPSSSAFGFNILKQVGSAVKSNAKQV